MPDASKATDAMNDLRDICDGFSQPAFPWSYRYLSWELFEYVILEMFFFAWPVCRDNIYIFSSCLHSIIRNELFTGLGFSLMAVIIILVLFIGSITTALLTSVCVASTLACVLGVMFYWDIVIDNIAVINLVLAVGLSVDYSAHVGHAFVLKRGTGDERAIKALASIGAAVLNGAVSTFLAVVVLSASRSYVFRVLFRQFFATVTIGAGHGLILLPVLLSLLGPPPFTIADDDEHGYSHMPTDVPKQTNNVYKPHRISPSNSIADADMDEAVVSNDDKSAAHESNVVQTVEHNDSEHKV